MKITILSVGKLKEGYLLEAVSEYKKRLSRYVTVEEIVVQDEKTPDGASEKVEEQIKEKEGERILSKIKEDAYVIALAIDGKMMDSVEFSQHISQLCVKGNSHFVFVIGGSLGLSAQVLNRSNEKLSFSKMTFPHQLMKVFLLEQIYRSYRIMNNEPYHK